MNNISYMEGILRIINILKGDVTEGGVMQKMCDIFPCQIFNNKTLLKDIFILVDKFHTKP